MRRDVVTAYVESLLRQVTGSERIVADHDGDYPVRYRSAKYYIRVVGDGHADVQVFAVAVDKVEATPQLLADINDLNTEVRFARVFHVLGQVLVEADLLGEAIDPPSFHTACDMVAYVTDHIGPQLAAKHGGRTSFEDAKDDSYQPTEPPTGMYL
jgi:hypothetical protein